MVRQRRVLALSTLGFLISSASFGADYYWCEPLRGYYPQVANCPVPWRKIPVMPSGQLPYSPPKNSGPSPSPPQVDQAEIDRQKQNQINEEKIKATDADNIKRFEANGYEIITFFDFKLDGKHLASCGAKVMIAAIYYKEGDYEIFKPDVSDTPALGLVRGLTDEYNIYVDTSDAGRDLRKYLLECSNTLMQLMVHLAGCPLRFTGRVVTCTAPDSSGFRTKEQPCIKVGEAWSYRK